MSALIRPLQPAAETPTFRAPPHNLEAEQALLGAILVNNEACDRVSSFLKQEHFYDALHGRIYDHAAKLIWAGKRATPITLKTFFQGDEPAGDLTVPQYLGRLAANATTIINAEDYGRTIYDLAIRRQLIQIGEGMVNVAYDAPIDAPPAVQIEDTEQKLYDLAETGKYGSGFEPFTTALTDAIDMAANAYRRDGGLSGLATGFTDLDQRMGGLQPSDLIIVAGRPSMGKTALATNIAYHVAQTYRRDPDPRGHAPWSGSSRSKCGRAARDHIISSRPISLRSASAAAASSPGVRPHRRGLQNFDLPLISTRPAASPWLSSPRGRGARSVSATAAPSSSTISTCCRAHPGAPPKAVCRRFRRSPRA
jgi:replicative DNA helicase